MSFMIIPRSMKTLLCLHAQFLDVRHSQMILSADRYISQSDLKVAKAGLQGAAGPLPEREVSSQKLFFPVFRVSPAATHEKQDVSGRMPRLLMALLPALS